MLTRTQQIPREIEPRRMQRGMGWHKKKKDDCGPNSANNNRSSKHLCRKQHGRFSLSSFNEWESLGWTPSIVNLKEGVRASHSFCRLFPSTTLPLSWSFFNLFAPFFSENITQSLFQKNWPLFSRLSPLWESRLFSLTLYFPANRTVPIPEDFHSPGSHPTPIFPLPQFIG